MKQVITTEKLPIKLWLDDLEEGALAQARDLANLPFAFRHVAIMPDGHQGFGMPIGGVLASVGAVVPNAVGVDIGCGMIAASTDVVGLGEEALRRIVSRIREVIPVGFAHHEIPMFWEGFADAPDISIVRAELDAARRQLGTLGGGNHFIEIQADENNRVWIMIHSGSRNFGYRIANEYHARAKMFTAAWFSAIPTPDLAFFPLSTDEAHEYIAAMDFALRFAAQNRFMMMEAALDALQRELPIAHADALDVHHNYAAIENHFGQNVLVHRKGATRARAGELGIIPGSMGSASYIVRGLGNPESFSSCSHGAGRSMGRKAAIRTLHLPTEQAKMSGVIHSLRTEENLDEAPGAYKDIDAVVANQADLVEIVHRLRPLASIKG